MRTIRRIGKYPSPDCNNHIVMLGDHFCRITLEESKVLYDGSYVCYDCPLMKWVK